MKVPKFSLGFVTLLSMTIALSSSYIELAHAQQSRWYAAYFLYGYETFAEEGVSGKIYTINPAVPSQTFIAEWVTIVLSYSHHYWLQVGYSKGYEESYQLKYYWEQVDEMGRLYGFVAGSAPSPGTWHKYMITHPYGYQESSNPREWKICIDGAVVYDSFIRPDPSPYYEAVDQQAAVETTSSVIKIDESHLMSLSYFTQNKYWHWVLWPTHVPRADPPYSLVQISNYEFYAYGGG
jgi:hypothetical protein